MNRNDTRTLWISVAVAIFAIFLMYSYSQEQKAEYDRKYGTNKRVVIAKKEISEMETLDESMIEIIEKPEDFIQPEALRTTEEAVGKVAAAPMKVGEQILSTKLLTPGPDTGIASQVAPDRRALTLPADELRTVSRLLRPGDRVDLIAALDVGSGMDVKKEVKTIMQDVGILATGLNVVNNIPRLLEMEGSLENATWFNLKSDSNYRTITVEVTQEQAQTLVYILATNPASLFMTLRNPNDRNKDPVKTTGIEAVLGRPDVSSLRQQSNQERIRPLRMEDFQKPRGR